MPAGPGHWLEGGLLLAPLGRKYRRLYAGERTGLVCGPRLHRLLASAAYTAVLLCLLVWVAGNCLYFMDRKDALLAADGAWADPAAAAYLRAADWAVFGRACPFAVM